MYEMIVAYVVGTAAGIILYRRAIQEDLIAQAIDTLVREDYVRSYEDDEGITHLYKWYDLDDVINEIKEREEEQDDSP